MQGHIPIENPPFQSYIQSPIGLVPKDSGRDTRLIFHLSYPRQGTTSVNANTPDRFCKVKYPDFSEAIKLCIKEGISCSLSRSDMKSAFRNLGLLKRQWKFLLMKARNPVDGKWYLFVDKCLPFGSGASCKIFQEFSDCIAHLVQWKTKANKKVTNYLDDFLFIALMRLLCNLQCSNFLEICRLINFPVALDKTFWGSTQMIFLGFLIDTVRQVVCVPVDKISKGVNMIDFILHKKKITLYELQRVCGYLNFLGRCIVPGRAFTRRLYGAIKPSLKQHHHIRVTGEMRLDLTLWLQFLKHPSIFARPFMDFDLIRADELDFYTDATKNSRLGFGGYYDSEFMYQTWDKSFILTKNPSIGYLELYAVTAALLRWMPKLKNRRVVVFVDNESTKTNLNTMSSKCKNSMVLIRLIVLQQMIHNVRVYGKYVSSKMNKGADDLSRLKIRKFIADRSKKGINMMRVSVPECIWPMNRVWFN